MNAFLKTLYESLQKRLRPEDVAELILDELTAELDPQERRVLEKAARHSLKRGLWQISSMTQEFRQPVAPVRQARKATELFASAPALSDADCADVEKVSAFVAHLGGEIRKVFGANDFRRQRLDTPARRDLGLEISRRRYNKLFRFLSRFEAKLATYRLEQRKYQASRIAKSGLAVRLSFDDFSASRDAACFVAYFSARSNRRSVFTNQSQDRPFDEVAEMLLARFRRQPHPSGWRAIARVMPDAEIVAELSEQSRLELLAVWLDILADLADLMRRTWEHSRFDRATMIVKRGDDSSTWNALAGAWNAARQGWLAVVTDSGMDELLEKVCPGKAMRLMAADVAAWHQMSGGKLEPDTQVWASLPPPWEVFFGEESCTRADVEKACRENSVDPEKKNWTMPRGKRQAVAFTPTPELVHGVTVAHPQLATVLRKAGWFSGKTSAPLPAETENVIVMRDPTDAALYVESENDAV